MPLTASSPCRHHPKQRHSAAAIAAGADKQMPAGAQLPSNGCPPRPAHLCHCRPLLGVQVRIALRQLHCRRRRVQEAVQPILLLSLVQSGLAASAAQGPHAARAVQAQGAARWAGRQAGGWVGAVLASAVARLGGGDKAVAATTNGQGLCGRAVLLRGGSRAAATPVQVGFHGMIHGCVHWDAQREVAIPAGCNSQLEHCGCGPNRWAPTQGAAWQLAGRVQCWRTRRQAAAAPPQAHR